MKVLVVGPALTRTGYGEHCRFVLRALKEVEGIDLYLLPVNWGQSNWIWEDTEERRWMDFIVKKTALYQQQEPAYDVSIQVTIPNEWKRLAPVNIGVTAGIETTKVAPQWLGQGNQMDKIITISEHSKQTFVDTVYEGTNNKTGEKGFLKCNTDIDVVHYPVKNYEPADVSLDVSTKFNFLTVAQWGPRKNLHNTVTWFIEEFIDNPDVGLIVKTFIKGGSVIDRYAIEEHLNNLLSEYGQRKCKVYLLHGDLTDAEIHSLYQSQNIQALISLSHGEGFGLPLFEAAYSGLPVIATDWSGHLDFLYKPTKDKKGKEKHKAHFARVEYDLAPIQAEAVWNTVLQADSSWAYAKQGSYKMKLREVYKNSGRFKKQAKELQKWILKSFTAEKQYQKFNNSIEEFLKPSDWTEELDSIELV